MSNITTVQTDSVIVSLMRASTALTEAKTIQHTKQLIDLASAAEIWAKRQQLGDEAVGIAISIKVEALRNLGVILQGAEKATGRAGPGRGKAGTKSGPAFTKAPTLAELGLTKKESAVAQKLAELPDAAFEQVREGNETMSKALSKAKADKDAKAKKPVAAKPPKEKPALSVVQPPPPEDACTDLDAAQDQVKDLQDALVIANMGKVSDEDRGQAKALIAELRARIRELEQSLKAVTVSRDTYQAENAQLRNQINRQRREIDRATGKRTA